MTWTLRELVRRSGVSAELSGDATVAGLAYDPATVVPGDLFFCIPGERADGHTFAAEVAARGAVALLVERTLDVDLPQARVGRVRDVLGPLAATFHGHPSHALAVAAVTGTNGKTTVTYLLESIATAAGMKPGVIGTVSRRFEGESEPAPRNTPEATDLHALLRRMLDGGVDAVFLEATSDGLEQGRLRSTRIATAGFTNLTQDHLNTHGTMNAYFEAKALLFDRSYTDRAVINVGDPYGRVIAGRIGHELDVLTYGTEDASVRCERSELGPRGSRARLATPVGVYDIDTALVGRYNLDNCMCAWGMAMQLGIAPDRIAEGIRSLPSVSGRLEPVDVGQPFLVLVDYAHTPDALAKALSTCREIATERVIVVFGCGGDRDRAKRPLMGAAATQIADLSFITSDNPRSEEPVAIIEEIEVGAKRGGGTFVAMPDRREAIGAALDEARAGDVVLVAGKGHEQGQQFADHTVPFDDRKVVAELLRGVTCRS